MSLEFVNTAVIVRDCCHRYLILTRLLLLGSQTVETVTYRVVCKSLMRSLSSAIGSLHGIPIMDRADIRLYLVPSPHVQLPGGTNPDAAAMYAANMLQVGTTSSPDVCKLYVASPPNVILTHQRQSSRSLLSRRFPHRTH